MMSDPYHTLIIWVFAAQLYGAWRFLSEKKPFYRAIGLALMVSPPFWMVIEALNQIVAALGK